MTERERFEEWAVRYGYDITRMFSGYKEHHTMAAWEAWQERARQEKEVNIGLMKLRDSVSDLTIEVYQLLAHKDRVIERLAIEIQCIESIDAANADDSTLERSREEIIHEAEQKAEEEGNG